MRLAWLLLLVQGAAALMSSSGETYTRRWRDSVFVCFEYAGVWHDGIEPFATLSTTDGALTGDNQCVTPLVGAFATSASFPLHYHAANYKPCCEVPRYAEEAIATIWDYVRLPARSPRVPPFLRDLTLPLLRRTCGARTTRWAPSPST